MGRKAKPSGENELTSPGINRLTGFERAVEYIENNLTEKLDYEEIAKYAYCSNYHFQRIFSVYCGCTLGEYIRARKMTLAAADLKSTDIKIIDLALKYGYENGESFSRAFTKFHGVTPSQARKGNTKLRSFSRLSNYESDEGGNTLDYKIEKLDAICLCGYKKRFYGVPYGDDRKEQENDFSSKTKMKQWIVNGISSVSSDRFDAHISYRLLDDFNDYGYDFYYAQPVTDSFTKASNEKDNSSLLKMGIGTVTLPAGMYAVFKSECLPDFYKSYISLCRQILCEWAVSTNYQLARSPEIVAYHQCRKDSEKNYAKIYIPLEMKL